MPNEDIYKFVGECYLHGFMDGEAMVGLEEETGIIGLCIEVRFIYSS
jgi:hypothetical protein